MLIAGVDALCIVLAILGFLVPRLSDHARRGAAARRRSERGSTELSIR
jgi:hypothetical protein